MRSRAVSARGSSSSCPTVSSPASIASCAMPAPIAPRPTTPIVSRSRAIYRRSTTPAIAMPKPTHIDATP